MYSYLTSQLARQQHRDRQDEQHQAHTAARATAARRAHRASRQPARWAVRSLLWLRSQPQR
jgi:hypothetical protein